MTTRFGPLAFTMLALAVFLSSPARAQRTPPPSDSTPSAPRPGSQNDPQTKSEKEKQIEKKEQSERALGVLPQFFVTSRQDAPPLSSREKFHLFAKSAFDPAAVGAVAAQAGLSQAVNEFPGYGQGAEGYGKRFGASLADEVSSTFWTGYFFPVLFRQDPRYFRLGEGSFGHRLVYGVKQEFVCHTDRGGRSFSYSNVLGAFTSGAISNLYYPGKTLTHVIPETATTPAIPIYENDRGLSLTLSRSAIALAYGMAGGLFDEFWPDLRVKLFHRHPQGDAMGKDGPTP